MTSVDFLRFIAATCYRNFAPLIQVFRFKYKLLNFRKYKNNTSGYLRRFSYILSYELDNFDYTILNKEELLTKMSSRIDFKCNRTLQVDLYNNSRKKINSKLIFPKIKERNFVLHALIQGFEPTLILDLGTKRGVSAAVSSYASSLADSHVMQTHVISVDIDPFSKRDLRKFDCGIDFYNQDSIRFIEEHTFKDSRVLIHSDSKASNEHIIRELESAKENIRGTFLFIHNKQWSNANANFDVRKMWELDLYEFANHSIYPGREISVACYKQD